MPKVGLPIMQPILISLDLNVHNQRVAHAVILSALA
jgi:hypothetical protein